MHGQALRRAGFAEAGHPGDGPSGSGRGSSSRRSGDQARRPRLRCFGRADPGQQGGSGDGTHAAARRKPPKSLKVGRCKVYDLIRSGELESIKIGRLRRIPVDSLRRFAQRLLAEGLE